MPPRRRRRRGTRTMPPRRNNASLPSYSFTVHHPPHSTWPWLSNANANRTSKREQNILIQILITEFDFQCQLRRYICTPNLVFTQCRTQIRYQLMTWGPKWLPSAEIREGWWGVGTSTGKKWLDQILFGSAAWPKVHPVDIFVISKLTFAWWGIIHKNFQTLFRNRFHPISSLSS